MLSSTIDIFAASILIVDDQEANVTLLEMLLSDEGYTNVSATMESRDVCALHRQHRYDLILLDLQLPFMDGFQVIEALKTNQSDPYLSVIVLTAQPGHKMRALLAGAKDFISKPFDLLEVKTRIRNVLEVRLLYKKLEEYNKLLEQAVLERTAELRESEARFRSLTELAADWYWEQDETGRFTKVSGPVLEMLGIQVDSFVDENSNAPLNGWNQEDRRELLSRISQRQTFLDFSLSHIDSQGVRKTFRVSGQPMFSETSCFIGYRGVGVEEFSKSQKQGGKTQHDEQE
jgi:PAS domain S-box-containing protein